MWTKKLFPAAVGDEVDLAASARAALDGLGNEIPDKAQLAALAAQGQVDLASRMLFEALLRDGHHGAFIRQVDGMPIKPVPGARAPLLIIVPGMFYRQYPEIGADGSLLIEVANRFGIETELAPTASLGSVSGNVELLHQFLLTRAERPFWLVSISRGSAEVKWLLNAYPEAPYLRRLTAWVGLCGIVAGTPLHHGIYRNRVLKRLHRGVARLTGVHPDLAEQLLSDQPHWQPTRLPAHLQVVNLISVPPSWQVTQHAATRFQRICHLGPTDGVVLLADYLTEPGVIYPVWGVDHFMRSNELGALLYRLLNCLLLNQGQVHEQVDSDRSFAAA